jgi:hypothetical protein
MVTGVAFCPHPPLLVPEVAQGAAAELDDLRAACRTAIKRAAPAGSQVVVIGSGPRWQHHEPNARGSLAGYGVHLEVPLGSDEPGPIELPLSLTVGAWLLRDALGPNCGAVGYSIGPDGSDLPLFEDEPVALLVMGDASARRSTTAPGYYDARAERYDAALADFLRGGTPLAMAKVDVALGDELLATAPSVWAAAMSLLSDVSYTAELLYDEAPYGVGYLVAAWARDV